MMLTDSVKLCMISNGPDWGPEAGYWLIDDGIYIGEVTGWWRVCCCVADILVCRQSFPAGSGFDMALLRLLLAEARQMGLVTALIMYENNNHALRRVIENVMIVCVISPH